MTYLRSSNMPPFPSPERSAACSLPMEMTRPSRHSSGSRMCGARWHATFTGDFRLRGDTRDPHRPLRGARRRRRNRPCKAGPRPVLPNLCAPRLSARPDRLRGVPRHGALNWNSSRFAQPIAVQGEAKMNKNDSSPTSPPRRPRPGPPPSAWSGPCSQPSATRSRGTSPSQSRPRGCRRSRRRRPFETRSTDSVAGQAARCRPFVPATPPPQVRAFAMHTRRNARPGSRKLPLRLLQADRRARASRIAWSPDALHAEGDRTGVRAHSPRRGTFVAGRGRRNSVDSSHTRTHAQSRAELESPCARVPYMAGCKFSASTVLRTAALQSKSKRFLHAYDARDLAARRLAHARAVLR